MTIKNYQISTALSTLIAFHAFASVSDPWTKPSWGFVAPQLPPEMSHSLIFDQHFDHTSYVPIPSALLKSEKAPEDSEVESSESSESNAADSLPVSAYVSRVVERILSPSEIAEGILLGSVPLTASKVIPVAQTPVAETPKFPSAAPVPVPAPVPVAAATPIPVAQNRNLASAQAVAPPLARSVKIPKESRDRGTVFVVTEDSLFTNDLQTIPGATVTWIGLNSGKNTAVDEKGVALAPFAFASSLRFIVSAPGYLPALGYAVANTVTPIVLVQQARVKELVKTFGFPTDPSRTILFGFVLDKKLRPVSNVEILPTGLSDPFRIYYASGTLYPSPPQKTEKIAPEKFLKQQADYEHFFSKTGTHGNFLITGLRDGLQYLMPTEFATNQVSTGLPMLNGLDSAPTELPDWPASLIDLTGLPQVVSYVVQKGDKDSRKIDVVDAMTGDRAETAISAIIGGQKDLFSTLDKPFEANSSDADEDTGDEDLRQQKNNASLDSLYLKNVFRHASVDLLQVRAKDYLSTSLNLTANRSSLPKAIGLFTHANLEEIFANETQDIANNKAIVMGRWRTALFPRAPKIELFDSNGDKVTAAKILFFDKNSAATFDFAILGLKEGEYHLLLSSKRKGSSVAQMSVLRVVLEKNKDGSVTENSVIQLQF